MINLTYLIRLGLSLLIGLSIGYERENLDKPAGLRTVTLVIFGATLFTIISLILRDAGGRYDLGRIIAYSIIGIGFIGTGIVRSGKKDEGITTASLLWSVVGLGILCGLGEYALAIISGVVVYIILKLKHIQVKFESYTKRSKNDRRRNYD